MEDDWAMCLSQQQLGYEYWFNTRSGKTFWCLPTNREKVAIIVPFRDLHAEQKRSQQLARFAPEMAAYLGSAEVAFKIYIIEQSDDGKKFNRGKLLNAGFDIARREGYSVFVLHDVDLIPSAELLPYYISPPAGSSPVHIARVWNRYSGNFKYFGGVVAFSTEQYEQINGYPNNYWGWGGEDDEMHNRVQEMKMTITAPTSGTMEDMEQMNLEQKTDYLRKNSTLKCNKKWELLREHQKTWKENGIVRFQDSQPRQYYMIEREYLNDYTVKITVDLTLNGDWSDQFADQRA